MWVQQEYSGLSGLIWKDSVEVSAGGIGERKIQMVCKGSGEGLHFRAEVQRNNAGAFEMV